MALDLSENGRGFDQLREHDGHELVCTGYGSDTVTWNMVIECETCGEVLVDFDNPAFIEMMNGE